MPRFAVMTTETSELVWRGDAAGPVDACRLAVVGITVGPFLPYDFEPPEHKDDGVERLVLDVYRGDTQLVTDHVGTFMALVLRG